MRLEERVERAISELEQIVQQTDPIFVISVLLRCQRVAAIKRSSMMQSISNEESKVNASRAYDELEWSSIFCARLTWSDNPLTSSARLPR
jgi:hypothetical protein